MTKGVGDRLRFLKGGNGHLAGHGREIVEEFVELLAAFQVIKKA